MISKVAGGKTLKPVPFMLRVCETWGEAGGQWAIRCEVVYMPEQAFSKQPLKQVWFLEERKVTLNKF